MLNCLKRLLREPLIHFFALGAGIFILFGVIGDSEQNQPDEIVVTAGQINRLVAGWHKVRMRAPTAAELEGLIEDHIREEIYYREALAMGLDSDDMIIRRRLRQKMEFLTEDLATQAEPTEADLKTFLQENVEAFSVEPRFTFSHIYFSQDIRGNDTHSNATALLAKLRAHDATINIRTLGDPLPLQRDYESVPESEIRNLFGQAFAARLLTLEKGSWQGPVRSGYGMHLVYTQERTASGVPELEDVRDAVIREWREARRREGNEKLYQHLRERYTVTIELPEWVSEDTDFAAAGQ